jgi:hypothetical protein
MSNVGKIFVAAVSGFAAGVGASAIFVNYACKHKKKTVLNLLFKKDKSVDTEPEESVDIPDIEAEIITIDGAENVGLKETSSLDGYEPPKEGDGNDYHKEPPSNTHIKYLDIDSDPPSEYDDVTLEYSVSTQILRDDEGHKIISPETIYGDEKTFIRHVRQARKNGESTVCFENDKTRTIYTVLLIVKEGDDY